MNKEKCHILSMKNYINFYETIDIQKNLVLNILDFLCFNLLFYNLCY